MLQDIFFKGLFVYKFGHFWVKHLNGWYHKLETLHVETLGPVPKKSRKYKKTNLQAAINCEFYMLSIQIIPHYFQTWISKNIWI